MMLKATDTVPSDAFHDTKVCNTFPSHQRGLQTFDRFSDLVLNLYPAHPRLLPEA
jgi:hypothetical protein